MNTVNRFRNLWLLPRALALCCAAGIAPAAIAQTTGGVAPASLVSMDVQNEGEGTEILLKATAPLTWTSYDAPGGVFVVELAGTATGRIPATSPIGTRQVAEVRVAGPGMAGSRAPGVSRVEVVRAPGGGKASVTADPEDHRKLRIRIASGTPPPEGGAVARIASLDPTRTSLTFDLTGNGQPVAAPAPAEPLAARQASPDPTAIRTVEARPLPGGVVVDIAGDGPLEYTSFTLESPSRLVLDIPGAMNRVPRKEIPVGQHGIQKVRIAQNQPAPDPVTRVVVDLEGSAATSITSDEAGIHVYASNAGEEEVTRLAGATRKDAPVVKAGAPLPQGEADAMAREAYDRGDLRFDDPVRERPSDDLVETADVDAAAKEESQRFIQQYQAQIIGGQEQAYTGRPISLDLRDAPILDIFRLFHDLTGLNIVVDPSVRTQTITIDVLDVPWDQVLDLILKTHSLGKTLENNVLRIAPSAKLTQEEQERQQLRQQRELAGELVTVTKTLSYAKASEINPTIRRFLSPRGDSILDDRTNTIIIKDLADYKDQAMAIMEALDVQGRQVMIESRIVETVKNFSQAIGIQWGFQYIADRTHGNTTNYSFPHFALIDGSPVQGGGLENPLEGYAVNLPIQGFNSAIGISLANILNTFQLDIALMALENKGKARIISAPKVVAQNNEVASIESGTDIPIVSTTATEIDVRYVSASLRLEVTPQITADGTVLMELTVENNSPSQTVSVGANVPAITTRRAQTTVLIRDGGTTVIGGIYQVNEGVTQSRVPFLHRIPLLGWLFKNKTTRIDNNELLIFITPRILK